MFTNRECFFKLNLYVFYYLGTKYICKKVKKYRNFNFHVKDFGGWTYRSLWLAEEFQESTKILLYYTEREYIYIEQLAMETIGTIHSWSTWTYMEDLQSYLIKPK